MSKAVKLTDAFSFQLPVILTGRADVSRVLREIERVDYELETEAVHHPDRAQTIPTMSKTLMEITHLNQINILDPQHRTTLLASLRRIKDKSPVTQLTFAVDPSPDVVAELTGWIRQNLHGNALITIGVQPAIVGGCVVRTPDHIYDFSLRGRFRAVLPELGAKIKEIMPTA